MDLSAVAVALVIPVGDKGLLSIFRIIACIVRQTLRPEETYLTLVGRIFPDDALLLSSRGLGLNMANKHVIPFNSEEETENYHPSREQLAFWESFDIDFKDDSLVTLGQRLAVIPNLKFGYLTKKSRANSSRQFGRSQTTSEWVTYFDDDDLMHPDRTKYIKMAAVIYPEQEAMYASYTFAEARPGSYKMIRDYFDSRLGDKIDAPSVGWKDALEKSTVVAKGQCPDAPDARLDEPLPIDNSLWNYNTWQESWYHDEMGIPQPDCDTISIAARPCSRRHYHFGWSTIKRELSDRIPMTDWGMDETVSYGWRILREGCAKMQIFPAELGLYLHTRFWKY